MRHISDKKAYLFILILLFFIAALLFVYIKDSLLYAFQEAVLKSVAGYTGNRLTVERTGFGIFKGLVMENIRLFDEAGNPVIIIPEVSSGIFFPAFVRPGWVVPQLRVRSPVIRIRRLKHGRLHVIDLKEGIFGTSPGVFVATVKITGGQLYFLDESLPEPYEARFSNVRARISFDRSSGVGIHAKLEQSADTPAQFDLKATLALDREDIHCQIGINALDLRELSGYLGRSGLVAARGSLDASLECLIRKGMVHAVFSSTLSDGAFTRSFCAVNLNARINGQLQHNLGTGTTVYAAKAVCDDARIDGVESIGPVQELRGTFIVNNDAVSCDKASARIWGIPAQISFMLTGLKDPLLVARLHLESDLSELQRVAAERKFFGLPGVFTGQAYLALDLRTYPEERSVAQVSGILEVRDGTAQLPGIEHPLSGLAAVLSFGADSVRWSDLRFSYGKRRFRSSGELTDFAAPRIRASCVSDEVSFDALLTVQKGIAEIHTLKGQYFRSSFDLSGRLFLSDPLHTKTSVQGRITVDALDIQRLCSGSFRAVEAMDPAGQIEAEIAAEGILINPDTFTIKANGRSSRFDCYGLTARSLEFVYDQAHGVIEIPRCRFSFYGGSVNAEATINSAARPMPFWIRCAFDGVHLEELKQDTSLRAKELSGVLGGDLKLRGIADDLRGVEGAGAVSLRNGRLWELNLFKKLGKFLFAPEYFTSIVFKEGSATFAVRDAAVHSDDLKLKSQMSTMEGRMKVGFDGSLDGSFDVVVLDEMVPLTGTFKDVTTAIVGRADRFGSIIVSGSLQDPDYEFRTAVGEILLGIGDMLNGQ